MEVGSFSFAEVSVGEGEGRGVDFTLGDSFR